MADPEMMRARFRPAIVAIAPAALLIGFAYHPYVAGPTDEVVVAAAAASDTTRWGLAHLAIGVGYGLLALAFIAIRSYLREWADESWSALGLPFVVLGCALFPILTGMEFAVLAAVETHGDAAGTQAELTPWFVPVLLTAGVSFALGALGFAKGIADSKLLSAQVSWLVIGALIVMVVARFVPLGAAQPVIGAAGVVALWPLAYRMWKQPMGQTARHS